uniref:Uncharacterized protein n=1 Tax=Panagrellus redivivus TaxID=6233 RepID=A0A7E4W0C1_PANRE
MTLVFDRIHRSVGPEPNTPNWRIMIRYSTKDKAQVSPPLPGEDSRQYTVPKTNATLEIKHIHRRSAVFVTPRRRSLSDDFSTDTSSLYTTFLIRHILHISYFVASAFTITTRLAKEASRHPTHVNLLSHLSHKGCWHELAEDPLELNVPAELEAASERLVTAYGSPFRGLIEFNILHSFI